VDFCQSETFQPRCLPGEAVFITKAIYGRMCLDSRCLQNFRHWEMIRSILAVSRTCRSLLLPDVLVRKTATYEYRIRKWIERILVTRIRSSIYWRRHRMWNLPHIIVSPLNDVISIFATVFSDPTDFTCRTQYDTAQFGNACAKRLM